MVLSELSPAMVSCRRSILANHLFEAADYGCLVVGSGGWVWEQNTARKVVYLENPEDPDGDSVVGSFEVTFRTNSADVARYHALDNKGNLVASFN